jgi:hypothetical protein
VILTAIMASFAAAAAPTAPMDKAIWGPLRLPDGSSAFRLYRRLGVGTFQIQLDFAETSPERPADATDPLDPAYRWPAEIDEAIEEAAPRDIDVALLVNRAPPWANGGRVPTWAPRPQRFRDFLTAASRRYPAVRRWMIWGEPNRSDRFQPAGPNRRKAPRVYARVLDAAYAGLKKASRRNVVIGGMTWTGGEVRPVQFLHWLRLPNGRRPRLDWYGHNPFPFRYPRLKAEPLSGGWRDISDMDLFVREVAHAFPGRPRLWLSEFTIQSDQPSNIFELHVTRRQQARWLTAAYRIANRLPQIAGLGWIGLLDQPPGRGSSHWGLMTYDGRPKPALEAYRKARGRP